MGSIGVWPVIAVGSIWVPAIYAWAGIWPLSILVGGCVGIVVGVTAFLVARWVTVKTSGEVAPLPRVDGETDWKWIGDLAVAKPELDAMVTVFKPYMLARIPKGDVVKVLAVTERLAHKYAEHGFERRTESRRRLYLTV